MPQFTLNQKESLLSMDLSLSTLLQAQFYTMALIFLSQELYHWSFCVCIIRIVVFVELKGMAL